MSGPYRHVLQGGPVIVDCDRCEVRDLACEDCVVSVLLGGPPSQDIGDDERRAMDVLAVSGLVPPLRFEVPDSAAS